MQTIQTHWPNFDLSQQKIDSWHEFLKDSEFDIVSDNLKNYIKNNRYEPKVSDLLKPAKVERERYIPSVEDTKAIIQKQEEAEQQAQSDPDAEAAKLKARAEINKMLGRG